MKVRYYGHSCFSALLKGQTLLFDPFITGNELANAIVAVDEVAADYILVSHGHEDHIADCIRIASRTNAKIIVNWEIHTWLQEQGITNTHPMNTGGSWNFGNFSVKCTAAQHSSSLPNGRYGGNPLGFIVSSESGNFYYSGDTALSMDMQLIPQWAKLNFAVLPIGSNFTMDVEDAIRCAKMIEAKTVMGVHYNTFPFIRIEEEQAIRKMKDAGITLKLLNIGEEVDFHN